MRLPVSSGVIFIGEPGVIFVTRLHGSSWTNDPNTTLYPRVSVAISPLNESRDLLFVLVRMPGGEAIPTGGGRHGLLG